MVFSYYNEFIDAKHTDGYEYLFNSLSKKWIKLDCKLAGIIRERLDDVPSLEQIHPELFKAMADEGFIVQNLQEEIAEALTKINDKLASKEHVTITINPTLDCNLRCWYCYEEHLKGSMMNQSTVNGVVAYIGTLLKSGKVKKLHLAFFGGEPLLGFRKVVQPVITAVSQICKENNVGFDLHFTTNAVCMTSGVLEWLMPWVNTTTFQIAFDGGEENHDSTKHFANGLGSYRIVLEHTKEAIRRGFNAVLRCNYNKDTLTSFIYLIEDLKEFLQADNLRFSFNKIWQAPNDRELLDERIRFIHRIEPYNINSNLKQYLANSLNPCYGDYRHNMVINYNGDIFKCTARAFKRENRLGYIDENGTVVYDECAIQRTACHYTPYCFACRILPICPVCSQARAEADYGKCPIGIDNDGIIRNYQAAFQDLSGIKLNKMEAGR